MSINEELSYHPIFISCTQAQYENRHNLTIKPINATIIKESEETNESANITSNTEQSNVDEV